MTVTSLPFVACPAEATSGRGVGAALSLAGLDAALCCGVFVFEFAADPAEGAFDAVCPLCVDGVGSDGCLGGSV